jgi:hypothetical protein
VPSGLLPVQLNTIALASAERARHYLDAHHLDVLAKRQNVPTVVVFTADDNTSIWSPKEFRADNRNTQASCEDLCEHRKRRYNFKRDHFRMFREQTLYSRDWVVAERYILFDNRGVRAKKASDPLDPRRVGRMSGYSQKSGHTPLLFKNLILC